ncbi:LysR family transcriptional regulator [Vibrio sp. YMD68]|uniref:helix-turn-helix domain-containing protein n=1 Tax=Vibrio sp. YMD68 TaxID=3042300 RepID=UPI00249A0B62|nr:LysR family transcriptional regulator [Vibrio sp. YMD68]WGV98262.1 LysR family transcriptional regulator [Vibrio sp. YMD68]
MKNISSLSELLIHFEAIYRYDGLRAAALKTGIPLCRLSRSLNDLEAIVKKKLFYSDKNEFKPTREGGRLYHEVDTNSMLINLSHQLNEYMNYESIKACVLPQIKMNLSGEIISNYYHYRKDSGKVLSVTITSEYFNEREMYSQLRACDLDIVLSYYKFDSIAVENKQLYIDEYSFYQINNDNNKIEYLAMLDLGNTSNDNFIADFIDQCCDSECIVKSLPRLILPDIDSLLKVAKELPLIVLLNKASIRRFVNSGVDLKKMNKIGTLELPVYISYHKMNPKKKLINMVSETYQNLLKEEDFDLKCLSV